MKEELIALLKTFEKYGVTSTLEENEPIATHYHLTLTAQANFDILFESSVVEILDTLSIEHKCDHRIISASIEKSSIPAILLGFAGIHSFLQTNSPVNEPQVESPKTSSTASLLNAIAEKPPILVINDNYMNTEEAALSNTLQNALREAGEDPKITCQNKLRLAINQLIEILGRELQNEEKSSPPTYAQVVKNALKTGLLNSKNNWVNYYLNTTPTAVWVRSQLIPFQDNQHPDFSYSQLNELVQLLDSRFKHVPSLQDKAKKANEERLIQRYLKELGALEEAILLTRNLLEIIKEQAEESFEDNEMSVESEKRINAQA